MLQLDSRSGAFDWLNDLLNDERLFQGLNMLELSTYCVAHLYQLFFQTGLPTGVILEWNLNHRLEFQHKDVVHHLPKSTLT